MISNWSLYLPGLTQTQIVPGRLYTVSVAVIASVWATGNGRGQLVTRCGASARLAGWHCEAVGIGFDDEDYDVSANGR